MKIQLPHTLRNRGSNTDKDAVAKNCVVESRGAVQRLVKRPALEQAFVALSGGGQLITVLDRPGDDPEIVVVTDDNLTNALTPTIRSLSFFRGPDESDINQPITPSVIVHVLNSLGYIATEYIGNVGMEFVNNPTGSTLGGTATVAAVSGVATFTNLRSTRSGAGFTIRATDSTGLRRPVSAPFNIPTQLVFTVQPTGGEPGDTLDPFEVTAQDLSGNTDVNFTGEVTISLYSASAPGELGVTLTVTAVAGVSSFTNVEISEAGTYALQAKCGGEGDNLATSYKPASSVSSSFNIGATHTLVAGQTSVGGSVLTGFSPVIGSLTPTTYEGSTIVSMFSSDGAGFVLAGSYFVISGVLSQPFFTSITINGLTLNSSDATFTIIGGINSEWRWNPQRWITATGTYPANII